MTDLDLLIAGAMVTFISVSAAYIAIRHRANEDPVESFQPGVKHGQPGVIDLARADRSQSHVRSNLEAR